MGEEIFSSKKGGAKTFYGQKKRGDDFFPKYFETQDFIRQNSNFCCQK
jgi:hypothetical protein